MGKLCVVFQCAINTHSHVSRTVRFISSKRRCVYLSMGLYWHRISRYTMNNTTQPDIQHGWSAMSETANG